MRKLAHLIYGVVKSGVAPHSVEGDRFRRPGSAPSPSGQQPQPAFRARTKHFIKQVDALNIMQSQVGVSLKISLARERI
jgi:hypothetical protein